MKVVGFGCTAQVGKDTAAEYLEEKYPGKLKRVAFADELKKAAMVIFGLSREQCYGSQEIKEAIDARYGKSPRQILQELGEKMREIFPDIWIVNVFNATIPELQKQGYDYFAISDVRYPNEANWIRKHGGAVVRVNREGSGVTVGAEHSSETAMKNFVCDVEISNNGTFEEYFEKLDRMMEEVLQYGGDEGQDNN
jgi:lambda repressor-like predicted transcriptional regulator